MTSYIRRSPHGESVTFQFIFSLLNETGKLSLADLRQRIQLQQALRICILIVFTAGMANFAVPTLNASSAAGGTEDQKEFSKASPPTQHGGPKSNLESAEDWNRRLRDRSGSVNPGPAYDPQEYVIGPEDVLDINVFEATELNRGVRVSASGDISLPLLGAVAAAGLTPRELETTLEELLRQRYMKDPHVSVFVRDMQSHPVSVMGAVRMPGVFQIRGKKTLVEILSLAEGLADDAGETAVILRKAQEKNAAELASAKPNEMAGSSPEMQFRTSDAPGATDMDPEKAGANSPNVVRVNLKDVLDSTDPRNNPTVYPGDIVKVSRAGIVYVVGAVGRPGGFAMKTNEKISVLQAIALSEGLTRTASKSGARIIRTDDKSGARTEAPVDLGKVLSGKSPDPMLGSRDILFVPDSMAKTTYSRSVEVAVQTLTGLAIFRW